VPLRVEPAGVEAYVEEHTTSMPAFLDALAEETRATLPSPGMLSGPVEGRFLQTLVFLARPRLVLEIGTYSGYSALAMAGALPEDGRIVTCEVSEEHAAFARRHIEGSPHGDRIELRVGPALDTIAQLEGPFDLVFIDADKPAYGDYYEAALPKLGPHGLIVVDNTLWSGDVVEPAPESENARALQAFNDLVAGDARVVSVMLTVRDGITLIRRAG
jgi:caffeoyl-CoA O-methyltransferase